MISARGNIIEQTAIVQDGGGYRLEEQRVSVDQIELKWGSYTSAEERLLSFHPEKSMVVSHFRLTEEPPTSRGGSVLGHKQFVVYREKPVTYELPVAATGQRPRSFFELALSETFFNELVTADSVFLKHFQAYAPEATPYYDFIAPMSPVMFGIIQSMQTAPYTGVLKGLYLEAKAVELFLLQIKEFDRVSGGVWSDGAVKLSAGDIERLHYIRDRITTHFDKPWSIALLAREAGLNQMKLKSGFKIVFGTTLFGYLSDIRMEEARRLLVQEKLYVGEVAEKMGYQHPHHFTKAFRKKFGILPSALRQ